MRKCPGWFTYNLVLDRECEKGCNCEEDEEIEIAESDLAECLVEILHKVTPPDGSETTESAKGLRRFWDFIHEIQVKSPEHD